MKPLKPATDPPATRFYEFGHFRLDTEKRLLARDGQPVTLTPKAYETLLALVRHSGRVIEKSELMEILWPDSFVEENNLNQCVSALRKALGESPEQSRYIKTVPGRGYRFVAEVRAAGPLENDRGGGAPGPARRDDQTDRGAEDGRGATPRAGGEVRQGALSAKAGARSWRTAALFAAFATLVGLGVLLYSLLRPGRTPPEGTSSEIKSIAVLPFRQLNGAGADDEYLGVGLADALITSLSNSRRIVVRPTSAILKYDSAQQDPLAAGREQGVDSILVGTLQRAGDRVRVDVQLLRVGDGRPLWASKFDEKFTDIFKVQDSISEQVTRALLRQLSGEEQKEVTKRYTESAEAYQFYLKGRYHLYQRRNEDFGKAIDYFQQATREDPSYALAYAGLADSYGALGSYSVAPGTESALKSAEAATKAIQLDDTLSEAHAALGSLQLYFYWNPTAAESEFKRAIELNPNSADAHYKYSYCLVVSGHPEEAIAEIKRAQELDPLSLAIMADAGEIYYFARRADASVEQLRKAVDMDPNFVRAHFLLGRALEQKRDFQGAVAEFQMAAALSQNSNEMLAALGQGYAAWGRRDEAQRVLDQLEGRSKQGYISPHFMAIIYASLNDRDRAFEWLDKAVEKRFPALIYLKVNPIWDNLHSDPRFTPLLRKIGIEP
jgi:DNA-binding winged helix-turn-helix (wHTH) protein/TolB-like protein/Flp pilus assembly protein TadD